MAILPSSGFAANGKLILDWNGAAAQLTRTGNTWAFGLGQPVSVTYAFRSTAPSTMPSGVSGFQPFNSAQIIAAETALQLWADVANITFIRVGSGTSGPGTYSNSATMLFSNYTTETDPASAFAYLPTPGATSAGNSAGDIWVDASQPENVSPVYGDFGPHVLAHEIGHAIGINHPGEYDGGSPTYDADAVYWQDARMFTVMSYFGSLNTGGVIPTFSWGPQYHDIAAAQRLYGPNMSTRTGDTTYGFNNNSGRTLFDISSAAQGVTFSIWDAGGVDTLDLSGYSENADIDLRPGAFSSAGPTDDRGPAKYNISIAVGARIENAIGGAGHDTLTGNYANNSLVGNNGNDFLIGGAGADTMNGGAGVDTASYVGEASSIDIQLLDGHAQGAALGDVFISIEAVIGTAFNDAVGGDAGSNLLSGGDGDDLLDGGLGADTLDGSAGFDVATYAGAAVPINAQLWNGTAGNGAAGDVWISIEGLHGSSFNDVLAGDNAANLLDGGAGNDLLYAGQGLDTLVGGEGADWLDGGADFDVVSYAGESAGMIAYIFNGRTAGAATGDTFVSIEGITGTAYDDYLAGDSGPNLLSGGAGRDGLFGGNGADTLFGGPGDDVLVGNAGADLLEGDAGFDTASYADSGSMVIAYLFDGRALGSAAGDTFAGIEALVGTAFNDWLAGDSGANSLTGGAGNDGIFAGAGNDTLIGGVGNDTLVGGLHDDRFVFRPGDGADRINDFGFDGATDNDVLELQGYGAAFDSFAEVMAVASQQGADTLINFGGGNSILLVNVNLGSLSAADFLFS